MSFRQFHRDREARELTKEERKALRKLTSKKYKKEKGNFLDVMVACNQNKFISGKCCMTIEYFIRKDSTRQFLKQVYSGTRTNRDENRKRYIVRRLKRWEEARNVKANFGKRERFKRIRVLRIAGNKYRLTQIILL